MQKEIMEHGSLLDENGRLIERGWARSLIRDYHRSDIKANPLRIKEWDYYLINDGHRALALTIADNAYMGMYSVSWIDLDSGRETTNSVMTVLPMGKTGLPETSVQGDVGFANKDVSLLFRNNGRERNLRVWMPAFRGEESIAADITLRDAPAESMVIATPYREDDKAFYYNQKINCMKAEGNVVCGSEVYSFASDSAYGVLDWGRGVWTYSNTWYWGSASGTVDGHSFGFNIGYGFGDTTAASENVLVYDGHVHKLDQVVFHIPAGTDGKDDYLSPWHFTSNDKRFEMDFTPVLDRAADTNVLIIRSDQHQVFGRFSGRAVLDDGTVLQIKDLAGFAEKVRNRW